MRSVEIFFIKYDGKAKQGNTNHIFVTTKMSKDCLMLPQNHEGQFHKFLFQE